MIFLQKIVAEFCGLREKRPCSKLTLEGKVGDVEVEKRYRSSPPRDIGVSFEMLEYRNGIRNMVTPQIIRLIQLWYLDCPKNQIPFHNENTKKLTTKKSKSP